MVPEGAVGATAAADPLQQGGIGGGLATFEIEPGKEVDPAGGDPAGVVDLE